MTEPQFEEFLSKSIKNFGDEYIELDEDLYEPHEFSPEFERKMEKLFRPKKHIRFPLFRTRRRRIASVVTATVVLSSAAVMSVGAVRGRLFGFKMKKAATNTFVTAEPDGIKTEGFDKVYEITELPEGFVLTDSFVSPNKTKITKVFHNGDEYIRFEQWNKNAYQNYANTEQYNFEIVNIDGTEVYLVYTSESDYVITWEKNNYILSVMSNIDIFKIYSIIDSINVKGD